MRRRRGRVRDPLPRHRDPPSRQVSVERLPRHARGEEPVQHRHRRSHARGAGDCVALDRVTVGRRNEVQRRVTISHLRSLTQHTDKIGQLDLKSRKDHQNEADAAELPEAGTPPGAADDTTRSSGRARPIRLFLSVGARTLRWWPRTSPPGYR